MAKSTIGFLLGFLLLCFCAEAVSANGKFDANGNLTAESSRIFYSKIEKSLLKAVGEKKYISDPFPEMFMASGYFRNENGSLFFINPTFGFFIFFESQSSNPIAISVTELFSILGDTPTGEADNFSTRYVHFNKYINEFIVKIEGNREDLLNVVRREEIYRDIQTNRVFISEPVMRAANQDVRACYSDFPADRYGQIIDEGLKKATGSSLTHVFKPVDLVPLPDNAGVLILTDSRSRSLYSLIPLKRVGNRCTFSEPKFLMQD